jgi:alpha-D-xyloside xylohydrolase
MAARSALTLAALAIAAAAGAPPPEHAPWHAPPQPVVTPFAANSFRIQYAPPGLPVVNSTYSPFLDTPASATPSSAAGAVFVNGNLRVTVDAATGLFAATRVSDGAALVAATALTFAPALARGRYPSAQLDTTGAAAGETLVGMGEQGLTGRATLALPFDVNFIDSEFYPLNSGRTAFMPLLFSSKGYGVMVAQQGYGWLHIDRAPARSSWNASSTATVEVWITTTPGTPSLAAGAPHPLLAVLEQYADAVGHAPPMAAFAAGFIASKDRYNTQKQFLDVAHGYVDRNIPLSVLTIDWFHWAHLGDMSLNPACWPDPSGMVAELRGLGIETMITHWPFMSANSVHRAAYEAAGALAVNVTSGNADTFWSYLEEGALVTTLSPATANLTAAAWWDGYGQHGVRALWLDETEPFVHRTAPAPSATATNDPNSQPYARPSRPLPAGTARARPTPRCAAASGRTRASPTRRSGLRGGSSGCAQ